MDKTDEELVELTLAGMTPEEAKEVVKEISYRAALLLGLPVQYPWLTDMFKKTLKKEEVSNA
jgi:hypothetical protein